MADEPKGGLSGPAQAAIIAGLFGLMTTLITQWDKLFGESATSPAVERRDLAAPSLAPGPAAVATNKPALPEAAPPAIASTSIAAADTEADRAALRGIGEQIASARVPPAPEASLTGAWADDVGNLVDITQSGALVTMTATIGGQTMSYRGERAGNELASLFPLTPSSPGGNCVGAIGPGAAMIVVRCQARTGAVFGFQMTRAG